MICADCGKRVERGRNGRWVSKVDDAATYACRVILEGGRIARADYHYVSGETQTVFSS